MADALAGEQVGPGTKGEKQAASVDGMLVAGMATEGAAAGEAVSAVSKATKIESLTAAAEKMYPNLAAKTEQLHHVVPKYLGGAKDGELAKIPAAYHQVITNAFRTLAPYGQKISRTAEEVGQILKQVYSTYPLP